jgi:hypothetical protein
MYLRCSNCHTPTWIRSLVPGAVEQQIDCAECSQSHDLSRATELGQDNKSQYETANRFASDNGVDLPTAYSILLGLMTLAEARSADAEKREATRKAAAPPAPAPAAASAEYRAEASERSAGRATRPSRTRSTAVSQPHGLARSDRREGPRRVKPDRRAKGHAEGVTIHVEREMAKERKRLTVSQAVLLGILAALILGLTGRYALNTRAEIAAAGRTAERNTAASAEAMRHAEDKKDADFREEHRDETTPHVLAATIERDSLGRVIRIFGPNPQIVLDAYCSELRDGTDRKPIGLAQASPPDASERFGVFRDLSHLESDQAIRISRDRKTRKWVTGDGRGPIRTRPSLDGTALISSASVRQP